MTLGDMKRKVFELIEEIDTDEAALTSDPDLANKINVVINQVQTELARMKKIPNMVNIEVPEDMVFDLRTLDNFFQLEKIVGYDELGNEQEISVTTSYVTFTKPGSARIIYSKLPERITEDTDDDYEFELTDDALEVMPYGVAGDLLKSDVSTGYGNIYSQRYESMLQRLDYRYNQGTIYIDTGIDSVVI